MFDIEWRDELGGTPFSPEMMQAIEARRSTPDGTDDELDAQALKMTSYWHGPKVLEFWFLERLIGMGELGGVRRILSQTRYGENEQDRAAIAAGLALHVGLGLEGLKTYSKIYDLAFTHDSGINALCHTHDPSLVEVFFKLSQLKTMKPNVPRMEAWLRGEGANAVEGLVQMCGRRGKRREFALERLSAYVASGHVSMIEESLSRVPDKLAELVRAEVVSPPDPLVSEPIESLSPSRYPEWLHAIEALPEELIPSWLGGSFPLVCEVTGQSGVIPRELACRIVTAAQWFDSSYAAERAVNTYMRSRTTSARAIEVDEVVPAIEAINRMPRPWQEGGVTGLWTQLIEALRAGALTRTDTNVSTITLMIARLGTPDDFVWLGDRLRVGQAVEDDAVVKGAGVCCRALYLANDPRAWAELVNTSVTAKRLRRPIVDEVRKYLELMGLTWEQAYDRLVPTFGFDDDGMATFDYGVRAFAFTFDETYALAFREVSTGQTFRTLPPAKRGEDKALVAQHKATYKRMKTGLLRTIEWAKARFENALVTMQSWRLDELREHLLSHPLMRHVVRGMVWGVYDDAYELSVSFVFEQDGALTRANFDDLELPGDTLVRLVHPLDLSDAARRAWSVALTDSEIAQPIRQLGRVFVGASEFEAELEWFEGVGYKWGKVKSLDDKDPNWTRGVTYKGSKRVWYIKRELPELGLEARLLVKRNDWVLPRGGDAPRAGLHFFEAGASSAPSNSVPFERVPGRVLSEILREVREA